MPPTIILLLCIILPPLLKPFDNICRHIRTFVDIRKVETGRGEMGRGETEKVEKGARPRQEFSPRSRRKALPIGRIRSACFVTY
jgi:hypothetical protein